MHCCLLRKSCSGFSSKSLALMDNSGGGGSFFPASPHHGGDRSAEQSEIRRLREELRALKVDLSDKAARLESTMAERAILSARASKQGSQNNEEKNQAIDQV